MVGDWYTGSAYKAADRWNQCASRRLFGILTSQIVLPEKFLPTPLNPKLFWEKLPANAAGKISTRRVGNVSGGRGAAMRFQGQFCIHSAYLAAKGQKEEIRRELLRRYHHAFRLPQLTARGLINDPCDLEIGHVYAQLQQIPASSKDRYLAERLTVMRNALAHLECIPMSNLLRILGNRNR